MNDVIARFIDRGTALAERAGQSEAFRDRSRWEAFVATFRSAADLPLPRTHKQLRVPLVVAGRILSDLDAPSHAYARFHLPPGVQALTAEQLQDAGIREAADAVLDAWRDLVTEHAPPNAAKPILQALEPAEVEAGLDPGDFPGTSATTGVWSVWDPSALRALASLPEATPEHERVALACGLWAGSSRSPQLAAHWERAVTWMTGKDRTLAAPTDLASARVWALSRSGPVHGEDAGAADLVAWAYRRASTWSTFTTPDPEIHQRLTDQGYGDAEHWPDWVREAVATGRLTNVPARVTQVAKAPTVEELLAELDGLEGLHAIKADIRGIVTLVKHEQERKEHGLPSDPVGLHLVLTGNPGTGKTTVAGLYGKILRACGALSGGPLIEVTRADLVSTYHGGSAIKTREKLAAADGGVLFIDEAYSLTEGAAAKDLSVIDELVAAMESRRGSLALVVAGYPGKMTNFLASNPGLASRFRAPLLFPDFTDAQLVSAFTALVTKAKYSLDDGAQEAVQAFVGTLSRGEGFGNAREMRKLFDTARQNLATRLEAGPDDQERDLITAADIPATQVANFDEGAYTRAMSGLDAMAGLAPVKQKIKALATQVKVNQQVAAQGGPVAVLEIGHMLFVGNPGTGKTSVAGHLGATFAALGLLRSGHVKQVGRSDLVGQYLGQTAPKVKDAVMAALDGVLFIDEAYSLINAGGRNDPYGHEAVNTLVELLDLHRDRVVVVMAGYEAPMKAFLGSNPGLGSRVKHTVTFPDFSVDDLRAIAGPMVTERSKVASDEVIDLIARRTATLADRAGYANGRSLRNFVDKTAERQAERIAPLLDGGTVDKDILMRIETVDVPPAAAPEAPPPGGVYL